MFNKNKMKEVDSYRSNRSTNDDIQETVTITRKRNDTTITDCSCYCRIAKKKKIQE